MHWVRLFIFTIIQMEYLVDQAFAWRMRRRASLKSSLTTVEFSNSSALDYHIYLTVGSGNLDNAFCMCVIFLFIHFFMPTIKSLKASLVNEFYIWIEMRLAFCCCVHNKAKVLLVYFCSQSPFISSLMNFSFLFMHISQLYYERMNEWDKKIDDTS